MSKPGIGRALESASEFRTAKQIAARLGCSVGAIWYWKTKGQIPFYSIGKMVRFKWEDIERLITHRPTASRACTSKKAAQ
jgi:excisionase family DNA binding protein